MPSPAPSTVLPPAPDWDRQNRFTRGTDRLWVFPWQARSLGVILKQRMSPQNPDEGPSRGSLILGPGPRLVGLEPLLRALGAESVVQVTDLGQLLKGDLSGQRVLIDLTTLASEDGGILRRVLRDNPNCRLELIGGDPTRAIVQSLTLQGRGGWSSWPLDTDRLTLWARGHHFPALAGSGPEVSQPPVQFKPTPPAAGKEALLRPQTDPEIRAIERILGGLPQEDGSEPLTPFDTQSKPKDAAHERGGEESETTGSAGFGDQEDSAFGAGLGTDPQESKTRQSKSPPLPTAHIPHWYRDQVADLADIAQRLDLGLRRTLEASEGVESESALRGLSDDILRLGQFTRTIGYLAAPPGPDGSSVDLSALAQDFLSSLAHEEDGGPRYLFRAAPDAVVRAEKSLLVLAIDAILAVASLAAGNKGEVKVGVSTEGQQALLEVSFPPGPLAQLEADRWLEPYALHRLLPGVGPNAIPAAAAILAGQGGDLSLSAAGNERCFRLELPLA